MRVITVYNINDSNKCRKWCDFYINKGLLASSESLYIVMNSVYFIK